MYLEPLGFRNFIIKLLPKNDSYILYYFLISFFSIFLHKKGVIHKMHCGKLYVFRVNNGLIYTIV